VVESASDRNAAEVPRVIGESAAMRRAMELARRAAGADITVLLTGETGTGKSLLAGFLQRHSHRRDAPFVVQNCGALPETLCESELFGYRRGAFTGAVQDKAGLFEAADGGTIFLDEVSELGLAAQVKLLQVLQEGVLRRLGDTRSRSVDVRVIAATNRDLCAGIERGSFREDLYYRLNVVSILVPSLRERPEDIPRLASHFLRKHGPRINPRVNRLGGEALGLLSAYHYPGNVRELENLIQRALLFATDSCIDPGEWFPARGHGAQAAAGSSLADLEYHAILRTIALHEGNLTRAAHTLGISRTTLWRRIKDYRSSSGAS
jgi:transcriptional regulator with PAS, ATPase and Fis domain